MQLLVKFCQFLGKHFLLTFWDVDVVWRAITVYHLLCKRSECSFCALVDFSKKPDSEFELRSKRCFCHLWFTATWYCCRTYSRRNRMSTTSSVRFLHANLFVNLCNASFPNCDFKNLIYNIPALSGCILTIVWKKIFKQFNFVVYAIGKYCDRCCCSE